MSTSPILRRASSATQGVLLDQTAADAGWEHIGFTAVRLAAGQSHSGETANTEIALVVLGGTCAVTSSAGAWAEVGQRPDPFSGHPDALYLPPGVSFSITATTDVLLALCSAPVAEHERSQAPAAYLVRAADVAAATRGAGQATRSIRNIIMEDRPAVRLLITEVQSPAGNWSSYPPHKHDRDALPDESQLEETYYFQMRPQQGFAFQRVYTDDRSLDETTVVHHGDLVLVPRGYHVVAAAAEYEIYYLNVLAGPRRALRMSFDPDHEWIKNGWAW